MTRYGIRIRLPEGDPLAASHLLGPDWAPTRWYSTAEERDRSFEDMLRQLPNYRTTDVATQQLEKVEEPE